MERSPSWRSSGMRMARTSPLHRISVAQRHGMDDSSGSGLLFGWRGHGLGRFSGFAANASKGPQNRRDGGDECSASCEALERKSDSRRRCLTRARRLLDRLETTRRGFPCNLVGPLREVTKFANVGQDYRRPRPFIRLARAACGSERNQRKGAVGARLWCLVLELNHRHLNGDNWAQCGLKANEILVRMKSPERG